MNLRSSSAPTNVSGRYKTYGLFGGAVLGSVVGVLASGPNFLVWSPAQSVGVIAGLAVGMAATGYLFIGLIFGGMAGAGASEGENGDMSDSVGGGGDWSL